MAGEQITHRPAREASAEELEASGRKAFEVEQRILTAFSIGREQMWVACEALYEFDAMAGWKWLDCETKTEWLAKPEVGMEERTYRRMVAAWKRLHVELGVPIERLVELDRSKVDMVVGSVNDAGVTLDDALSDAETLGWRDLRIKYRREQERAAPKVKPGPLSDEELERVAGGQVEHGDVVDSDGAEVARAHEGVAWPRLLDSLHEAMVSGTAQPRIPAKLIQAGLSEMPAGARQSVEEGDSSAALVTAVTRLFDTWQPLSFKRIPTILNHAVLDVAEAAAAADPLLGPSPDEVERLRCELPARPDAEGV